MSNIWKEIDSKSLNLLACCLTDLKSDNASLEEDDPWEAYFVVDHTDVEYPMVYMIFITLVIIMDYPSWGQHEKTAWTIPVKFKDVKFSISHTKFGLRIYAHNEKDSQSETSKELIIKLFKATKIAERLIKPVVEKQLLSGNITIKNLYSQFYDRYKFFRSKAFEAFNSPPLPEKITLDNAGKIKGRTSDPFKPKREGFFYTQAMLDSFFSMLEHVLVLLLPFRDFNPICDDLIVFLSSDWTSKFNRILDPQNNPDMMRIYDRLQKIKERYRNTFAHGGFEKRGESLFIHFPHVGAIPLTLSQFKKSVHYSFFPINEETFETICQLFDDFENTLKNSPFRRMLDILASGLDIYFHREGIQKYNAALESDESLKLFLDYENYKFDLISNMDW